MNRAGRQNNQRGTSTLEFVVVLPNSPVCILRDHGAEPCVAHGQHRDYRNSGGGQDGERNPYPSR